jgi:hypothetical protein
LFVCNPSSMVSRGFWASVQDLLAYFNGWDVFKPWDVRWPFWILSNGRHPQP